MIKRQVFYSFHYKPDNWRAAQVRNIGVVEGNAPASDNDWETIKGRGGDAIRRWINAQMRGRSCTIVLVGSNTAGRKWIEYEIKKSWQDGKGVAGIYIHELLDQEGKVSVKGKNPFNNIVISTTQRDMILSERVKCYYPRGDDSKEKYAWISNNLSAIVEKAIKIRNNT